MTNPDAWLDKDLCPLLEVTSANPTEGPESPLGEKKAVDAVVPANNFRGKEEGRPRTIRSPLWHVFWILLPLLALAGGLKCGTFRKLTLLITSHTHTR